MPIPFDIIAVMLFLGYYAETPDLGPPTPGVAVAILLACGLLLFLAAAALNRITLARLRLRRTIHERRRLAGIADTTLRALLVAVYAAGLIESALPWSVASAMGWRLDGDSFAIQILGLAPYILFFPLAWLPMYGLHRETSYGTWTRFSFMIHKTRYNLYMLLAWIPFALLVDWLSEFLIALPLLFLLAAWAFPYLLARAWGCKPMPDGEVMDGVRRLEEEVGVRFSRVYLWEPGGGGVQNAAAVGLFPPFRYLFLTPALIKNMRAPELEAVILHELGHVKNKHLLFYLVTSLAGINLAVLSGAFAPLMTQSERFFLTAALVLLYFRVVFGWLSRNMERQADLFALLVTGSASGLVNALEKLAIAAGNVRLAASWHHLGIAQRVEYLRRAERRPSLLRDHDARISRMMLIGYILSLWVISAMILAGLEDYSREGRRKAVSAASVAHETEAHWRRVMAVVPDSADARLELAYKLAGNAESRGEAARLAGQARDLSSGNQTGAAARKLLRELEAPSFGVEPGDGGMQN